MMKSIQRKRENYVVFEAETQMGSNTFSSFICCGVFVIMLMILL